jgi:hypothetical protein
VRDLLRPEATQANLDRTSAAPPFSSAVKVMDAARGMRASEFPEAQLAVTAAIDRSARRGRRMGATHLPRRSPFVDNHVSILNRRLHQYIRQQQA